MCSNTDNGCGWVGELRSLDNHLTTCEYALLRCRNECMENNEEVRILRCNLDQHLENECPHRQYQCRHCKDTGRYCDMTTTHLDTCPKVKILCPNSDCTVLVPRCHLAVHKSECQFEKVSCKYAGIGCKSKPLRKDLKQHENNAFFHLNLAVETVNRQQMEINELQMKMKADKEEQKRMTDNIMAGHAGPCVFKLTEFTQHKSSKQEWYSPPFYTHPGGYKLCVRVDVNGNGAAAGTHVSVFAYLMKGKNDDNLPWPFTGDVTITLLNQLANQNHHTCTIAFPPSSEASGRLVDGEMSTTGYGRIKFISHDQLDHDEAYLTQYLINDCLHFRIVVNAARPVKPWLKCTI